MNESKYKVFPQILDNTIKQIIENIDKGYALQNIDLQEGQFELDNESKLEYNDCIILTPNYQREYRATIEDESSLVESLLVGIPIPQIFLVSSKLKGVQVLDVVDGQHRLRAFYRFRKGCFKLKGLKLLKSLEGKGFAELGITEQRDIISHKLSAFVFREFPGKEFELEIFNRYNKGTKTLTPQEIRNAVYNSPLNDWVSKFIKDLFETKQDCSDNGKLKKAYNITNDRFLKKKIHESIFALLYIIENGINVKFKDSTSYSEEYMKEKAVLFGSINENEINQTLNETIMLFEEFNRWVLFIMNKTEYPFSKEIYGVSSRNYKFQMSIAMLLAGVFKNIKNKQNLYSDDFICKLSNALENSYLEDPEYNASSTNSLKMSQFIDDFLKS